MAYDIKMVKQLRDATQAGFADCKKAVEESNGNYEEALDWLKKRGIAKASKKAGAIAAEGSIAMTISDDKVSIAEINAQTDFVALNDKFISAIEKISKALYDSNAKGIEEGLKVEVEGKSIEDYTAELTGTIGEKITLRRFEVVSKGEGQAIGAYLHANKRIGTVVLLDGTTDNTLAKDISMHAAAMSPRYIAMADVPADVVAKETEIIKEQMAADPANAKKPANVIEKMTEGKVKKALMDVVISEQKFVKDSSKTVGQIVKEANAKIVTMIRFEVGEGIETKTVNFEDEVKKQLG